MAQVCTTLTDAPLGLDRLLPPYTTSSRDAGRAFGRRTAFRRRSTRLSAGTLDHEPLLGGLEDIVDQLSERRPSAVGMYAELDLQAAHSQQDGTLADRLQVMGQVSVNS